MIVMSVFKSNYKIIFLAISVFIGILMSFLSFDYGITEDAPVHHEHGKRILDYFKGSDNTAALSPIDKHGNLVNVSVSKENQDRGMNGFGGFFDLLSNLLLDFFPNIGVYELRNMLNAFFGFLLFLFCGLLGKELGGWKAGVLSLVFAVLTPVLFGHAMCNPKDIPFAAFYMFSVFHMVMLIRELPQVTIKRALFLVLNVSILINIRLLGLIAIGLLAFAMFFWWFLENYKKKFREVNIKETYLLVGKVFGIGLLGYLAASVFWPYAQSNPIKAPIELFFKAKSFKGFVSTQLFEGEWRNSYNMPWYYMIKSLFMISVPIPFLIGICLIPLQYFRENREKLIKFSFVLFTSMFPLLLVVLGRPNSYDNGRQFLFMIPPLIVISSLSWIKLLIVIKHRTTKIIVGVVLGILLFQPLKFMVQNHPLQSFYFNPLVGGVPGAYGNYEIDYWGFSIKPAIRWLEENIAKENATPTRVRMYYGEQLKASYYLDKIPHLSHVIAREDSPDWDYGIVMLTEAKFDKNLEKNWPPKNTIHQIEVDKTPVCFIVKNEFDPKTRIKKILKELDTNPSLGGYLNLSLRYYDNGDYVESIKASRKALLFNKKQSIIYNNLCSAYNMLSMYHKAKEACEKSIEFGKSALAQNNLEISKQGIEKRERGEFTIDEYIKMSYDSYRLMDFKNCIKLSYELLDIDVNSSIAYNNICASYNDLGNFEKAKEACEKALQIDSNFQLAKNNLKIAVEKLRDQTGGTQ